MKVDAVVLAGAKNDGPLRACSSVDSEALITIGEKTMVEYVVDALDGSSYVKKIMVVGPRSELNELFYRDSVEIVDAGASIVENVKLGLERVSEPEWVLVVGSDIPLLTVEGVDDFLKKCDVKAADFFYPVVKKSIVEKKFGDSKRTYVKLRDGIFTGGNMFLVRAQVVEACIAKGQEFIELRKNPVALCRAVGLGFLFKFVTGAMSVAEAERTVSEFLGVRGKAVISDYPEVGVDVDKPEDYQIINRLLLKRAVSRI